MKRGMIIRGDWSRFIDLPDEELFLVKRKHPFVIIPSLLLVTILASAAVLAAFFIFTRFIPSTPLLIASFLIILSFAVSGVIHAYIYWYFHLYVLTNKKILEVKYAPLFSHVVNDIFLDNVNCTEIDLKSNGFFHELIDMGDLTITFDRPTHQEEFTLSDIKDCDMIGKYLTRRLMDGSTHEAENVIWMRARGVVREAVV
jgi:hypothetical protein